MNEKGSITLYEQLILKFVKVNLQNEAYLSSRYKNRSFWYDIGTDSYRRRFKNHYFTLSNLDSLNRYASIRFFENALFQQEFTIFRSRSWSVIPSGHMILWRHTFMIYRVHIFFTTIGSTGGENFLYCRRQFFSPNFFHIPAPKKKAASFICIFGN